MVVRRRWLQFSLRSVLIAMTASCLWFGWKVERARNRGRAIDAIVSEGGYVYYEGGSRFLMPGAAHFWLDLENVPVSIEFSMDVPPGPKTGSYLSCVDGIVALDLRELPDIYLQRMGIESIDNGCQVIVNEFVAPKEREWLGRKLPNCKIVIRPRKDSL